MAKTNHVLFITEGPFPFAIGTWRQLMKEVQTLCDGGFNVSVMANKIFSQNVTSLVNEFEGIKTNYFDLKLFKGMPFANPYSFLTLIKNSKPDLICAYNSGMMHYAALSSKIQKIPLVTSLHDINSLITLQSKFNFALKLCGAAAFFTTEFPAFHSCTRVITTTGEFRTLASRYYKISPSKIDVVVNSPSVSETTDIPFAHDDRIAGKFSVVYTGMIDHFRCLDTAIESLRYIPSKDFVFVVIGDTLDCYKPYLDKVKQVIARYNLSDRVLFLGRLPHKEALAYTKSCDVCIIPHKTNFYTSHVTPTKLHEYAALGKPIITTPLKPVLNLYGDSLLVWDGVAPKTLSSLLLELYNNHSLLKELGNKNRKSFFERYSWEVQSKKYLKAFKKCL